MAIAFDTISTHTVDNDNNQSFSHTTTTNSNRVMIVFVHINNDTETISSITYNGSGLTRIRRAVNADVLEAWYLVSPDTGTNNLVVNLAGAQDHAVAIWTFDGASQDANPIDTHNATTGNGASTSTSVTTTETNTMLVGGVNGQNAASFTPTTGQTERYDFSHFLRVGGGNEAIASAGSTSMGWSWSGDEDFINLVVALKEAAGGEEAAAVTPAHTLLTLGVG